MNTLKGNKIKGVLDMSYGSLRIIAKDGTEYRMGREELIHVLQQHSYTKHKARKFEHLRMKETV